MPIKQLTKNIFFAALSIVFVVGIFLAGFFAGTTGLENKRSQANASTPADLTTFWRVWNLVEDRYVPATSTLAINNDERVYGAIKGMVDAIGDPYTTFLTPEAHAKFEENITGNFSGVGMEVGKRDGFVTVIAPLKDTPAEKAGIKAGDVIMEIDGASAIDFSVEEAVQRIRGEKGTTVEIVVAREGESERLTFEVERDNISIPTLEYEMRDDGVFVISLFNFSGRVETEFREALREFVLARSDKLIVDVRGNPGGFLDSAVDISSWFLPVGKVVVREHFGANEEEKVFRSKGYDIFNDNLKMVVLVDGGSASASEIFAGAMKEHGIATIVGETTFGKGSVQELISVTEDTSLKVTIAQWLTPQGVSISENGLEPDVVVELTREDIEEGEDPQLDAAIDILFE